MPNGWKAAGNGSGLNGVGAAPLSQNCRKYLKSAKMVKYLSQRSRSNEPYRYSRSDEPTAGVRSAKLKRLLSDGNAAENRVVYSGSVFWFGNACGVGVSWPL